MSKELSTKTMTLKIPERCDWKGEDQMNAAADLSLRPEIMMSESRINKK